MTDNSNKHIYSLTVLRFIAAFMVLGYHFFSFSDDYPTLNKVFSLGYLGVDFFFILSGFVLGYSYYDKVQNDDFFSLKKFFVNRLARIAPLYYFALILSIPLFIMGLRNISELEKIIVLGSVPLTLSFTQSFTGLEITQEFWNVPAWSLSVEFFFYLIFPFISIKLLKSKKAHLYWLLFTLFNFFFYVGMKYLPEYIYLANHSFKTSWMHLPIFHLPQFLIGNCLACYYKRNPKMDYKYCIFNLILSLFIFITTVIVSGNEKTIPAGHPLIVIAFSLIIFCMASFEDYFSNKIPSSLILLGEASYSLYILQSPIKLIYQQFWTKVLKIQYVTGFSYAIWLSIFSILASVICYKFIEIPARKKIIALLGERI